MDEREKDVPRWTHEADMADTNREQQYYVDIVSAQNERTNKRMFVIILALVAVIAGCVIAIIAINKSRISAVNELRELEHSIETVYEYQFEQDADNDGSNYIVGGDFFGETDGNNQKNDAP